MAKTLSKMRSILLILTAIFSWSFLGGAGGCSGGGGVEQDQGPYQGPVRLVSIYPAGGPPGTIVSLCTQGIADEAIFSFCDQPVSVPEAAALRLTVEDDPSYTGCDAGTNEILLTVPESCPAGEVPIKAAAGAVESNTISFTVTVAGQPAEGGDPEGGGENLPEDGTPGGGTTPGGTTPGGPTTGGGRNPITTEPVVDTDLDCPNEMSCPYDRPVCDTTVSSPTFGDCFKCLADTDCHYRPEETGPGFRCDLTTKSCVELECTETDLSRCTSGEVIVDCTNGCACNAQNQCVGNPPPPAPAVIEVIADEGEIVGSSVDQMEYAAIKLTTHNARSAYIYGDFFFQSSYIVAPCPPNINPPPMGCGQRPPTDPAGTIWSEIDGWEGAMRLQPWVFKPEARTPDLSFDPLFQNIAWVEHDFEECWPDALPGDPHYCHGLRDYLDEHIRARTPPAYEIGTTGGDYSFRQSQRVFRYRVRNVGGEGAEEKIIFKMFKPEHRFWAVVETDAGNGEYPIEIIRPEEDALDLPHPKIDSCKVTPVRTAPFVRVDVNITGAATARVEAEFPGIQRLGGTGWLGGSGRSWRSLVIQRNLTLTSHDFHGMVYIPVKDHLLNVRCFASGVTVGGSGGGGIMRANKVVIGSETSERVDLDESDAYLNSLDLSEEDAPKFFKATPDEGQETGIPINEDCAEANDDILLRSFIQGTWSNTSHSYTNGNLSADDRIGQCDPKISWDFSQPMTVREITPPYPYNIPYPYANSTGYVTGDGDYRFPFAGEIKVAAYPDSDSLSRQWSLINEGYLYSNGTPTDSEAINLYKFVANDYTGGGILVDDGHDLREAPPALAYLGRAESRDPGLHQATEETPATLDVDGTDHQYSLSANLNKVRDYSTKNIYRIWVRQQTNAIGTAAIPRRQTLDLRYVSEFAVAESDIMEGEVRVVGGHSENTVPGASDFGGDGVINDPIYEPWVIKIPFKFQHIQLDTIQTQLLCWGQHPDTDGDGVEDYADPDGDGMSEDYRGPDEDADGDGLEDAEQPWWDRHDRSITTHRAGWLDATSRGQKRYFAHIGVAYSVSYGCPGISACGVDEYNAHDWMLWGPFHFSTREFPSVSTHNQNSEGGVEITAADQVQRRRGDFTNAVSAVAGSYFQFTTVFRECILRVKATGWDGVKYEKEVQIPSSDNWDELLKVGEVMEGAMAEEPSYFTKFNHNGEDYSLNPRYTTSHNFGSCTMETDCPFNCEELDGARPCNECRRNSSGQHKCYSREFDPYGLSEEEIEQLRGAFGRLGNRH